MTSIASKGSVSGRPKSRVFSRVMIADALEWIIPLSLSAVLVVSLVVVVAGLV